MTRDPKKYYYGQQYLEEDDFEAVSSVLHRRYISQGPSLVELEAKTVAYTGAKNCLGVSSGTSALTLACKALGMGEGSLAWTTAMSFVATANAIRHTGAGVDFVDIDPASFNIDLNRLEEKLKAADAAGGLPDMVMPVHFAGLSCDMRGLRALADTYGFLIIEDACHALGGGYDGGRIGSCAYSDAAAFSLHPVKAITAGEGGLVLFADQEVFERARSMRSHGMSQEGWRTIDPEQPWHREMESDGYNFRITEFQCALAASQMNKLDRFIAHRTMLANRYRERLADAPVRLQVASNEAESAWHILVIQLELEKIRKTKLEIFIALEACYIHPSIHYYPIPLNKYYRQFGYTEGMFPMAEDYYRRAFTMPMHVGLDLDDVDFVCDKLIEILE